MKKTIILLFITALGVCGVQAQTGIRFEQELSWQQVLAMAKAKHQYIFLDCYASWCGPCKMMERSVYSDAGVGEFFNAHFISFKLQLDGASADAARVMKEYDIKVLPTYLFFSPEGQLVHRDMGFQEAADFITLGKAALDPKRQYETLLAAYRQGKCGTQELQALALEAQALGEDQTAHEVAADYVAILLKLKGTALYTTENIGFIGAFTQSSKDKGFALLVRNTAKIDALMKNPSYVRDIIDRVVLREDIDPLLQQQPTDWVKISDVVTRKYDALTADRTVSKAKIFSSYGRDWTAFTAAIAYYTEKYEDKHNLRILDKNAHFILQYSQNKQELQSALSWSRIVLEKEPGNAGYQQTSTALQAKLNSL